jgi:hypothetical protein
MVFWHVLMSHDGFIAGAGDETDALTNLAFGVAEVGE